MQAMTNVVTIHVLGVDGTSPDFDVSLPRCQAYKADAVKKAIEHETGGAVDFFKFIVALDQVRYSLLPGPRMASKAA